MTKSELAKAIYHESHLTGTFTLRSGQVSNEYFDKFLYEANPVLLGEIAKQMTALIPQGTEVLAGLEMGAIPLVTALSLASNIPAAFVRKKAKNHGTCKLAEGADVNGKRVCVVEDNVTTGGQIIESVRELRNRGAIIDTVMCVIRRGSPDALEREAFKLIPLMTMEYITTCL